jgi:hypothetical protein
MSVFKFYLGKSFQAVGLLFTGLAAYRGIFHGASMNEEITLLGVGIGVFLVGWLVCSQGGE